MKEVGLVIRKATRRLHTGVGNRGIHLPAGEGMRRTAVATGVADGLVTQKATQKLLNAAGKAVAVI